MSDRIDDDTLGLIASRVVMALRAELEAIAVELGRMNGSESALTVGDVAERLGVARSTVYAHWREWGGYKLGAGDKASIRFQPRSLPEQPINAQGTPERGQHRDEPPRSRRRGRAILPAEPRLLRDFDDALGTGSGAAANVRDLPAH